MESLEMPEPMNENMSTEQKIVSGWSQWRKRLLTQYGTMIALFVATIVFSLLLPDRFPQPNNLMIILRHGTVITIVAVGLTVALILGDFDLSIGPVAGLAGTLAAGLIINSELSPVLSVAAALGAAALIGVINGAFVAYINVSAFIATLGMASVTTGLIFWYTGGAPIRGVFPGGFLALSRGNFIGIPSSVLIMIAYALVLWVLVNHTITGRRMTAVGGNLEVARLSGIPVAKTRMLSFAISSVSAGLGGILLTSTLGMGHPMAGDGMLLDAFAAAFLGAVTFRSGHFNIAGTVAAVVLLSVISNGLTMIGSPVYVQQMLKGVILLGAVAVQGLERIGKV